MNDKGPEVYAPAPETYAPRGRNVENSYPMPQPAFSVSPASCTLFKMSSIESRMVPETVQLMVDVAGLWSSAPAFEVTRPAGIAPWRSAHRNDSYQVSRSSSDSTSASARATRLYVSSIDLSMGEPSFAIRRYFLSQMS